MLGDFISLFYPEICASCGNTLYKHEQVICNKCYASLPKSNFHHDPNNALVQSLKGRFPFAAATSYYLFRKKGKVQKLLHNLKYKNKPEAGIITGEWFGSELKNHIEFNSCDYILPVPLHPNRQRQRGYNQSEQIALGMSNKMGIPIDTSVLYRKTATKTQTKKGRGDRWANVENIFGIKSESVFENKKLLLVDDVITTGATIEACASELTKIKGVKLYIASLAFAAD